MSFSKAEEEQDDELKCNEIKLKKKKEKNVCVLLEC